MTSERRLISFASSASNSKGGPRSKENGLDVSLDWAIRASGRATFEAAVAEPRDALRTPEREQALVRALIDILTRTTWLLKSTPLAAAGLPSLAITCKQTRQCLVGCSYARPSSRGPLARHHTTIRGWR